MYIICGNYHKHASPLGRGQHISVHPNSVTFTTSDFALQGVSVLLHMWAPSYNLASGAK